MNTLKHNRKMNSMRQLGVLAVMAVAAFLCQAPIVATAQVLQVASDDKSFTVRNYGGKCLDFGAATPVSGAPVYIYDCNGTHAQRVNVIEYVPPPYDKTSPKPANIHQVVLAAGNKVIGVKGNSLIEQMPLELQDFKGAAGQIFEFDGDSLILSADRKLVVEPLRARSANRTPLVIDDRDLADAEFWEFKSNDGLNRRPHSGFKRISQVAGEWQARADFLNALNNASWGTIIELEPNVSLDLSDQPVLLIPAGVTIRGDRRGTKLGPELHTKNAPDNMLFTITGNHARITGLRLTGPSAGKEKSIPLAWGIMVSSEYLTIIDHNELSAWPRAAIEVGTPGVWAPNNRRAENVHIVRNFIHHNRREGYGNGVATGGGGYATILGNTFVENRHAIAGNGSAASGYRAWFNLVLQSAPSYNLKGNFTGPEQDFDMHGTGEGGYGGMAGYYMEIARNTFLGGNRENFYLRGLPASLAEFKDNVTVGKRDGVLSNALRVHDNDFSRVYEDGNQYEAPNPTNRLGVGDFDGDGRQDLFLATGAAWYYSPAGRTEWRFLNTRTEKIGVLLFGDFDGDKRTDVFTQHNESQWDVSWGGASSWEMINGSGPLLGKVAIGDFNGDGRDDVFYADGAQWYISYSGTAMWAHFANAEHRITDLRFGDFNGDRKTDIFGVADDDWFVVYGGLNYRASLRAKLTNDVKGLFVADFNGDGRADVAHLRPLGFPTTAYALKVSYSGTGDWTNLRTIGIPVATGRFDGNAGEDVLTWHDNYLDIVRGGTTSARHSITDLR